MLNKNDELNKSEIAILKYNKYILIIFKTNSLNPKFLLDTSFRVKL